MQSSDIITATEAFLAAHLHGALATVNDDGAPCAIPVHLFYDEGVLYWFSREETRHSQNIARDPRVSITMWSAPENAPPSGLYVQSRAEKLDDDAQKRAEKLVEQRLGAMPPYFAGTRAYAAALGTPDEVHSSTGRWYFYS